MKKFTFSELNAEYQNLVQQAREIREMAYAPYSKLQVGAALLDVNGLIYVGCNVENASSGATICAERVAVANAISCGVKEFLAIAIVSTSQDLIVPCGICRQTLSEFGTDIEILCATDSGEVRVYDFSDLFPEPFAF